MKSPQIKNGKNIWFEYFCFEIFSSRSSSFKQFEWYFFLILSYKTLTYWIFHEKWFLRYFGLEFHLLYECFWCDVLQFEPYIVLIGILSCNGLQLIPIDDSKALLHIHVDVDTLFINKRFVLNELFQQNTSKFAIFYVWENPCNLFLRFFILCNFYLFF